MSERTFIRRFIGITGQPPGAWVIGLHLEFARDLLEREKASVASIGAAADFGSIDTFQHHFRMRFGTALPCTELASFSGRDPGFAHKFRPPRADEGPNGSSRSSAREPWLGENAGRLLKR